VFIKYIKAIDNTDNSQLSTVIEDCRLYDGLPEAVSLLRLYEEDALVALTYKEQRERERNQV
jgi:hypothetical protein